MFQGVGIPNGPLCLSSSTAEYRTFNPRDVGSNPTGGTSKEDTMHEGINGGGNRWTFKHECNANRTWVEGPFKSEEEVNKFYSQHKEKCGKESS